MPLALLAVAAVVATLGPLWETGQRAPEGTARAYLVAVEAGDLEGALMTLAPGARDAAREQVVRQLGNQYRIETLVLGSPSALDRVLARPLPPAWATLSAEVTTTLGERWKSTSSADLVEIDGVWYLTSPLFA
jgi:type VI protein secretion system component VasK